MINIFVAGAQKAGTTSLKAYLSQHPDIQTHSQLEMTYFFNDDEYALGPDWLVQNYGLSDGKCLAKHATMGRNEKALARLAEHNPECQIVFLTRDPVERTFSSYYMAKKRGKVKESFNEVLKIAFSDRKHWYWNVFIGLSCYDEQLNRINKFFPSTQIKVIKLEDMRHDPQRTMDLLMNGLNFARFTPSFDIQNRAHDEVQFGLSSWIKDNPKIKKKIRAVLGYQRSQKISELFTIRSKNTLPDENLNDYLCTSELQTLKEYFIQPNNRLHESWGLKY